MRGQLSAAQMALYSELQCVAATDNPKVLIIHAPEKAAARALVKRGLAVMEDNWVSPTAEAIEFRTHLADMRRTKEEAA